MFSRRLLSTSSRLRPTIRQLLQTEVPRTTDEAVDVHGWVKSVRRQKRVAFAAVSDGSCDEGLQAVFSDPALSKSLSNGASVRLTGKLVDSLGKGQNKELQVSSVHILGESPETYPIQKQSLTAEYLRDHCHLRTRTDAIQSMIRTRDKAMFALHKYFKEQDFTYTHVPILTANDCEGAGEAFLISQVSSPQDPSAPPSEFFGTSAYLTVSTQLHLEALAASLSRVYSLSPCFRAEPSQTSRHLAEFWMLEAECTFVDSVEDICSLVEGAVKQVLRDVAPGAGRVGEAGDDRRQQSLIEAAKDDQRWTRMTYTDAVAHLEQHHAAQPNAFQFIPVWGKPLQSEHERWLAEVLVQGPLFVTNYPASLKPFYMRSNGDATTEADPRPTVACFDLLVPGVGELAGGSLREERLALLEHAIRTHNLDPAIYSWYTDLRRYGTAPHGGFGMGFERLISWISGTDNVRECIPMPRWAGRILL